MDVQMYGRAMENIIFDWDVSKYVIVTTITIFDQVYGTGHNFITTDRMGVGY